MELVIDLDSINDSSKKDWLLRTLELMNIKFRTSEIRQSIEEYNQDLDEGINEYRNGELVTLQQLRKEMEQW